MHEQPARAELVGAEFNRIHDLANTGMNFVVTLKDFRSAAKFLFQASLDTRNPRLIKNAYNAANKGLEAGADAELSAIVAALKPMVEELEAGVLPG